MNAAAYVLDVAGQACLVVSEENKRPFWHSRSLVLVDGEPEPKTGSRDLGEDWRVLDQFSPGRRLTNPMPGMKVFCLKSKTYWTPATIRSVADGKVNVSWEGISEEETEMVDLKLIRLIE